MLPSLYTAVWENPDSPSRSVSALTNTLRNTILRDDLAANPLVMPQPALPVFKPPRLGVDIAATEQPRMSPTGHSAPHRRQKSFHLQDDLAGESTAAQSLRHKSSTAEFFNSNIVDSTRSRPRTYSFYEQEDEAYAALQQDQFVQASGADISQATVRAQNQARQAYLQEFQRSNNPALAAAAATAAANVFFAPYSPTPTPVASPTSFGAPTPRSSMLPHVSPMMSPVMSPQRGSSAGQQRYMGNQQAQPLLGVSQTGAYRSTLPVPKGQYAGGRPLSSPPTGQPSPVTNLFAALELLSGDAKLMALVESFDIRDPSHLEMLPALALDQQGSRFIQDLLEQLSVRDFGIIFNALLPSFVAISENVFGNYVSQKLLACGTAEQQRMFVDQIRPALVSLSCHSCGCRVVQRLIDLASVPTQLIVTEIFASAVLELTVNQFGNHTLQRAVDKFPPLYVDVMANALSGGLAPMSSSALASLLLRILTISTSKFGCRILQRLMERSSPEASAALCDRIVRCIIAHLHHMCMDQSANYVVQHILAHGSAVQRSSIISAVCGSLVAMGCHKYASNVVEKCFLFGNAHDRTALAAEVMNLPRSFEPGFLQNETIEVHCPVGEPGRRGGHTMVQFRTSNFEPEIDLCIPSNLVTLSTDAFGNYAVQTMLSVLARPDRNFVVQLLELSRFGAKVLSRFRENYGAVAAN